MGFLDEVRAQHVGPGSRCVVALLLESMDAKEREEVTAVFDMPCEAVTHVAITKALVARGYKVSTTSVSRHRKRECKCPSLTK